MRLPKLLMYQRAGPYEKLLMSIAEQLQKADAMLSDRADQDNVVLVQWHNHLVFAKDQLEWAYLKSYTRDELIWYQQRPMFSHLGLTEKIEQLLNEPLKKWLPID